MKKTTYLAFAAALACQFAIASPNQDSTRLKSEVGQFSFGIRSTWSLFGDGDKPGMGYGGQFRIRAGKRMNTEWYGDYIKTDIAGLGYRETAHIGWSVMFYPLNYDAKKGKLTPYILAGHCFDYAKVSSYLYKSPNTGEYRQDYAERWTSAVQLGIGTNYYITDKVDVSLSTQYMSHLGKELHYEVVEDSHTHVDGGSHSHGSHLEIDHDHQSLVLEGHLLTTVSLNVRLFDFIR